MSGDLAAAWFRPGAVGCQWVSAAWGDGLVHRGRADSTALSAPINYGPGLKALGWLRPDSEGKGALVPTPAVYEAIEKIEKEVAAGK